MATYEKKKLSGADALNTPFEVTSGSWVTTHQTGTSSTVLDEVWLWVSNVSSNTITISLNFYRDDLFTGTTFSTLDIPAKTTMLVLPGHICSGNSSVGAKLRIYVFSDNCFAYGYVNRITP